MTTSIEIILLLALLFSAAYFRISLALWTLLVFILLFLFTLFPHSSPVFLIVVWAIYSLIFLFLVVRPLRRFTITQPLIKKVRQYLPVISNTEREVLEAGDVAWEKNLFCGNPDWEILFNFPKAELTKEEDAFLNNQVNQLCALLDDWSIVQQSDLPESVWNFLKQERFFGLIIPQKYGGHGFSAYAHSTIITKIATRSLSAAIDIMVPNSVGLAEFILHYGTEAQKQFYLPRLSSGIDVSCFALTTPEAGSDAGAMTDQGIVCYGDYQGKKVLGIRLNWDKRYITLAPIATLIGLAFKMFDPDHLIGEREDIGITFCIIPRNHPGVEIGKRHLPLNLAFLNGPTRGENVFVPLDWIIGGPAMRGQGWHMMMECLSVGRGISLPALSSAMAQHCFRTAGAYVRLREQFHTSIGYFEGIKEVTARIGGYTYLCETARQLTASLIMAGKKPSIATAITKYHLTEMSRKIVNDAMDVHGGKAIQLGPRNYLAYFYMAAPIGITVEGANILTRNLIIFGQGALRCHPYIYREMLAVAKENQEGLIEFDALALSHFGYLLNHFARVFVQGITKGRFTRLSVKGFLKKYCRQLNRMSSAFALVSDVAMMVLKGELKRKERLSARLGDVLSELYLASAIVKYFNDQGSPEEDQPFVEWTLKTCLFKIQVAFNAFFENFPKRGVAWFLKQFIFPWGSYYKRPQDALDHQIANKIMHPSSLRDRLTRYYAQSRDEKDIRYRLEKAFQLMPEVEKINQKLQSHEKHDRMSPEDKELLNEFDQLRWDVIQVDAFEG